MAKHEWSGDVNVDVLVNGILDLRELFKEGTRDWETERLNEILESAGVRMTTYYCSQCCAELTEETVVHTTTPLTHRPIDLCEDCDQEDVD